MPSSLHRHWFWHWSGFGSEKGHHFKKTYKRSYLGWCVANTWFIQGYNPFSLLFLFSLPHLPFQCGHCCLILAFYYFFFLRQFSVVALVAVILPPVSSSMRTLYNNTHWWDKPYSLYKTCGLVYKYALLIKTWACMVGVIFENWKRDTPNANCVPPVAVTPSW